MLHVKWPIDDAEWFDGKERLSQLCRNTLEVSVPFKVSVDTLVEHSRMTIEYIIEEVVINFSIG